MVGLGCAGRYWESDSTLMRTRPEVDLRAVCLRESDSTLMRTRPAVDLRADCLEVRRGGNSRVGLECAGRYQNAGSTLMRDRPEVDLRAVCRWEVDLRAVCLWEGPGRPL